jgi:PAS domain S-box-containing protein
MTGLVELNSTKPIQIEQLRNMYEYNNNTPLDKLHEIIREQNELIKNLCERLDSSEGNNPNLRFDSVLDHAPFAYYQLDKNGFALYVNKMWEELHNKKYDEVVNKSFFDAFPKDIADEFQSLFNSVINGNVESGDFEKPLNNGPTQYYNYRLFPVNKENQIVGVEGFLSEITERKLAEEEVKASKEKYRIISENIPVVVYSALPDENSTNLFISGRMKELTGFSSEEFFSNNKLWKKIVYTDDRAYVESAIEKHRKQKDQLNIEYRIVTSSGEIKWVRDVASPYLDKEGNIERISGFMEDVSDRKNAEKALKMSEKKFRSLFDESQNCIYITSANGQIIDMNPAGLKLLGYTKEEMITQNATCLYANITDRLRFKDILDKNETVKDFEVLLQKKDGSLIDCILSSSVRKNEKSKIIGYQGIIRDVTAQKKAEIELIKAKEEAERADSMKTEFLAQMSHEIRTPINTILSFISLLNEEYSDSKSPIMDEYFSILNRAGKRIIRTIDLILNMSEIQTGSFSPKLSSVDLTAVLADLYAEYKSIASEKNIDLLMNIEKPDIRIHADEYSTTQILGNLLDNALKYTRKGKITIDVNEEEKHVELRITDTGIGISKKYLPKLFDSFTQEEQGYTRKYEGSGLGLALVKKYCDFNKASINVESKKNKGTTFILHFNKSDLMV